MEKEKDLFIFATKYTNDMIRHFFIIASAIFSIAFASCQDNPVRTITIVHSNDTHSQIEPYTKDGKSYGGIVERAAIIEMLREEDPSLLYFDAGDIVQGSPYFNIYKGELEASAMNRIGVDAATLGNHEFDNGMADLAQMLETGKYPIVLCNYDCADTPIAPYIKRKMTIERNGIKIGLTGVSCDPEGLIFSRNWAGITYTDPSEEANKVAAELKAEGCDLVVLLSHVGYENQDSIGARKIALNSKDIDIIIGGHSHTNIEEGVILNNLEGKPVYITQTAGKSYPMGRVQIEMQRTSFLSNKYEIKIVKIDKLHPENYDVSAYSQDMAEFIKPYQDNIQEKMGAVIGHSSVTMQRKRPQSLLGNFTADALRIMGEKYTDEKMDVGIMNVGGLRADLDKGDITIGSFFRIYPFENTFLILKLKGEYLEQVIKAIGGKGLEAISGMDVTMQTVNDKTQVVKMLVGGKPIDPNKIYNIATIDYLAEGNDGMTALTYAEETINTGILLRDVMIEYVQDMTEQGKPIESKLYNRVIVL